MARTLYRARVLVRQVQRVARELRAAAGPALDEVGVVVACELLINTGGVAARRCKNGTYRQSPRAGPRTPVARRTAKPLREVGQTGAGMVVGPSVSPA